MVRLPAKTATRDCSGRVLAEGPPEEQCERGLLHLRRPTSGASMVSSAAAHVLQRLHQVRGLQEYFYRDLHAHPELSHQERRTAAKVTARLRDTGCEIHERVGGTGVVALLRNGDGPAVLLRADMDALPVREATGVPYASSVTATTTQGAEVPVMHACGHDVHVTCLLAAIDLLAAATGSWNGTVVAVFQPAEEVADGARGMLDDGLAKIVGKVDLGSVSTRSGVPVRTGRNPAGPCSGGGGQHAHHRPRPRRPRFDAAGLGRPGRTRGHDRGPVTDGDLPRDHTQRSSRSD